VAEAPQIASASARKGQNLAVKALAITQSLKSSIYESTREAAMAAFAKSWRRE